MKVGKYMHLVVKCQNHVPKWGFIKTISYGSFASKGKEHLVRHP
jgi:hypothetical protein